MPAHAQNSFVLKTNGISASAFAESIRIIYINEQDTASCLRPPMSSHVASELNAWAVDESGQFVDEVTEVVEVLRCTAH